MQKAGFRSLKELAQTTEALVPGAKLTEGTLTP